MQKCKGNGYDYCTINKTELRQTGNGYEKECPVCGTKYNCTPSPERTTDAERQKIINRIFNKNPVANPGI